MFHRAFKEEPNEPKAESSLCTETAGQWQGGTGHAQPGRSTQGMLSCRPPEPVPPQQASEANPTLALKPSFIWALAELPNKWERHQESSSSDELDQLNIRQ